MEDNEYWKVLDAVVRLEVVKGHLSWTISDLSRVSGIGRTRIYYYFGKSKNDMVGAALKVIGDEFFGLSPQRLKMIRDGKMKEAILQTRSLWKTGRAPHILEFFFHWRHHDSEVRDHLKLLEARYLKKLISLKPSLGEVEAKALFSVFFGLVVVPELEEAILDRILSDTGF